ncbi:hypothetical protein [Nitratireductor sp. StC3]|uniref:hypothetical protein n=1 Tax=Nitratireductor sp. StC3 TaxID=2126741 RepID=UPI0018ED657B|nr:hypothetical protein [Nitratireductor sp. StC3]
MSLGKAFNETGREADKAVRANKPKRTRPSPFSIRLSEAERASLEKEAGGAPLGAYIKAKAIGTPPIRPRGSGFHVVDRTAFARGLALLGRSRLANNLNQLAWAVNTGSLPVTPETEAELVGAVQDVRALRSLFLVALGMKPERDPSSFANASEDT